MPVPREPPARLINVTVAEVAEALGGPAAAVPAERGGQLLGVYSVTVERRALFVLLTRNDDSFVWRVALARPMTGAEFKDWLEREADGTA